MAHDPTMLGFVDLVFLFDGVRCRPLSLSLHAHTRTHTHRTRTHTHADEAQKIAGLLNAAVFLLLTAAELELLFCYFSCK